MPLRDRSRALPPAAEPAPFSSEETQTISTSARAAYPPALRASMTERTEVVEYEVVEALRVQGERDLVDIVGVGRRGDGPHLDVAEQGDLALHRLGDVAVGAQHDGVGLDPDRAQLPHRVLGGLRLQLPSRPDVGREGHMDVAEVVPPDVEAELADGLEERQALDVADGPADLGDDHVGMRLLAHPQDAVLDLGRDVGDDLDGVAEVVATALLGDDGLVDRTGGDVGVPAQVLVDEALVVAEVEIGLRPVVGDEDLAVLEGAHGAGIDVDIGIELLHRHGEATGLEKATERGGGEALPQAGDDPTRYEDVLCHRRRDYHGVSRSPGFAARSRQCCASSRAVNVGGPDPEPFRRPPESPPLTHQTVAKKLGSRCLG